MKYPKKGTALPIKKIIGIVLILYLVDSFYQLPIHDIPYLQSITMGLAAYFLIISGRQL